MADFNVTEAELKEIFRIGFPDLMLVGWNTAYKVKYVTYESLVCVDADSAPQPTPPADALLTFLDQARQNIAVTNALSLKIITFQERYDMQTQLLNIMSSITGGDNSTVKKMMDYWNSL